MDTRKATTAAAGIILSLSLMAPVAFAQNAGTAQMPGATTERPQPPEAAPQAPGSPNAASAESVAQTVAMKIHQARRSGLNVKDAETEEKQGEAALRAGYKSEAMVHFRKAEVSLNEHAKGNSGGAEAGSSATAPAAESH